MLHKQVVAFMKMFAEVKGMQQLYKHKLLLVIFFSFLSNSDTTIAQLSLRCIAQFKLPFVVPYLEYLKGMLVKDSQREVLTKFKLSRDQGDIDVEHRNNLCPLIQRLLFGRLSAHGSGSKSSKDSPAVRRAAIISFLDGLDAANGEMDYFVYMMVRPFIPVSVDMNITGFTYENWNNHIRNMIQQVLLLTSVEEIACVPSQRLEGFLNLLQEVIKKLGFGVLKFVPVFVKIILCILDHLESLRKMSNDGSERSHKEEVDEDGEQTQQESGPNRVGKIRSLCFLRLSDILSQFADANDIPWPAKYMWRIIKPALELLPNSIMSASNPPSLLVLLETLSSHPNLITLLAKDECSIVTVFTCLSSVSKVKVADSILRFIDNLLTEGGLYDPLEDIRKVGSDDRIGITLIRKHVDLLVSHFTMRLKNSQEDDNKNTHSASKELSILCRVTLLVSTEERDLKKSTDTIATLCNLLIPFLDFGRKFNEKTQLDVLGILRSVLPNIGHDSAITHLQTFSRLLGPNKSNSGIKLLELRQGIIECIGAIAQNPSENLSALQNVVNLLLNLNASNPKHVDEWDFDRILPVLNGLGNTSSEYSWHSLSKSLDTTASGLQILMPIIYCCFHLLHDPDGILSRGAAKALNVLVSLAATERATNPSWQRLVETSLMACIRMGIKTHNISVRKSFIFLLSRVAINFMDVKTSGFCSDLCVLIREDEPELDFFLNITHVQIHRRSRALGRLRKLLVGFSSPDDCVISSHSLTNFLLPLALHPIYECQKKEEEPYAMEAIATVGAIAKLLPWGKYQNVLWTALMQVPRHESQERYIFAMISNIIDAFYFSIDVPHDAPHDGSNLEELDENENEGCYIWKQLDKKLIPTVERYLMKKTVDRDGAKNESLRAPVALALTKLFMKLPRRIFELKFPRLLIAICQALKNRDSDERDIARKTLAQVAITVDRKYLSDILRELAVSLTEGFKLHVRIATLHSILISLSKTYEPPDNKVSFMPSFDCCVPAMMDMIQQDLFGTASDMRGIESTKKRLVKEAGGAKSLDSLEIISRIILFNPSTVDQTQNYSSVHALVEPFLARLDDPEVSSAIIGKVKEALSRVVIGISQNSSVSPDEMFPFVYSTLSPYISSGKDLPEDGDMTDESDNEDTKDLEVSRTNSLSKKITSRKENKSSVLKVFNWAPSQLKIAKDNQDAYQKKLKEKLEQRKVQDGANAPKLTGSSRYDILRSKGKDLNSPAISCAISFGLGLLHSHLKKKISECSVSITDPLVKILYTFVKDSKDDNAVLLSLKCLQVLLRLDLPSVPKYRGHLAECILKIISKMSCNTQNEMVQSCFKILTLLLSSDKNSALEFLGGQANVPKSTSNPAFDGGNVFNKSQMQVLISILQSALTDAEHHNATFGVIKAVTSRRYISPEYYDLMDKILEMTVQSQKLTVRQVSCRIFWLHFSKKSSR
jgi:U3 small nucleolar RNA-associated protein 20